MNRQQYVLDKTMSLHVIKDKMQLKFAEQHADFITKNLETLIDNTYCVAPVRKANHPYPLVHKDPHKLTPSVSPLEKHWEEAIFRKWKRKNNAGLGPGVPFRKVVSYQVMLRETNKNVGWGELDLLGATAENIPVAIELKIYPSEYLLRAIVEVLAYGSQSERHGVGSMGVHCVRSGPTSLARSIGLLIYRLPSWPLPHIGRLFSAIAPSE